MAVASTSPTIRPLSRSSALASASPAQREVGELADVLPPRARTRTELRDQRPSAGHGLQAALLAAAAGRPSAAATLRCPSSPALSEVTRSHHAPVRTTMPRPRPVEALTTSRSRSVAAGTSVSDAARTSASLSTKSGASSDCRTREVRRQVDAVPPGHHRRVQARRRARGRPTPGRLTPTARHRSPDGRPRRAAPEALAGPAACTSSGAEPTSWSRGVVGELRPARSKTASCVRERPIATASTTPASHVEDGGSPGGRPPVDWPAPRRPGAAGQRR
jgi:hypothetical protein